MRLGEGNDERHKRTQRLLRRVEAVAGVLPVQHVADGRLACFGIAFGQQVGLLVLPPRQALARRVAFDRYEVADRSQARLAPGGEKLLGPVPAVETYAEAAVFEEARDFGKGWRKPGVGIVSGNAPAVA